MAYTGPLIREVSANLLQQEGYIANCKLKVIEMDYAPESAKNAFTEMAQNRYENKDVFQLEQNYIINSEPRLNFICKVIGRIPRNSLVLFHRIEHGKKVYEKLRQESNKAVYYVDGGTDKDIREEYKKKMEAGDEVVIVASYGTFSTGINIKRIDNVVFASPSKSRIRNLQSIGRGLRKTEGKDSMRLFDIADDLQCDNFTLSHLKERINTYNEENFPYELKQFDLK